MSVARIIAFALDGYDHLAPALGRNKHRIVALLLALGLLLAPEVIVEAQQLRYQPFIDRVLEAVTEIATTSAAS